MRPGETILAIFRGRLSLSGAFQAVQSMGTGFLVAPGVLVTCWHCVAHRDDEGVYAAVRITSQPHGVYVLRDIEQDPSGRDLATARLDCKAPPHVRVGDRELAMGAEVSTFGYPLTTPVIWEPGDLRFEMQPRFLHGYVTRVFTRVDDTFGLVMTYELDMLAPIGLSGAPLVYAPRPFGPSAVVGVIYGVNESYSIAEEAAVDALTGDARPEVRRLVTFALAHHTMHLLGTSGKATDGKPLRDYLSERSLMQAFPEG